MKTLRVTEQCIKPSLAYQMSVAPCRAHELQALDVRLCRLAKKVLKLPRSFPTAMLQANILDFGVGCTSMSVEYHYRSARSLVEALDDHGIRGTITRALLEAQLADLQGLDPHLCLEESRFSLRARQLASLAATRWDQRRCSPAHPCVRAPPHHAYLAGGQEDALKQGAAGKCARLQVPLLHNCSRSRLAGRRKGEHQGGNMQPARAALAAPWCPARHTPTGTSWRRGAALLEGGADSAHT